MMMNLSYELIDVLRGKTLVTAESCTGGGIGAALTDVPGSSEVYKGGIICYTNEVKIRQLGVDPETLSKYGAVSAEVACEMAVGARIRLNSDIAISVTGLAGPGGDDYGNPVGTVFIGYSDKNVVFSTKYNFQGDRTQVRKQAISAALTLVIKQCTKISKEEN